MTEFGAVQVWVQINLWFIIGAETENHFLVLVCQVLSAAHRRTQKALKQGMGVLQAAVRRALRKVG